MSVRRTTMRRRLPGDGSADPPGSNASRARPSPRPPRDEQGRNLDSASVSELELSYEAPQAPAQKVSSSSRTQPAHQHPRRPTPSITPVHPSLPLRQASYDSRTASSLRKRAHISSACHLQPPEPACTTHACPLQLELDRSRTQPPLPPAARRRNPATSPRSVSRPTLTPDETRVLDRARQHAPAQPLPHAARLQPARPRPPDLRALVRPLLPSPCPPSARAPVLTARQRS